MNVLLIRPNINGVNDYVPLPLSLVLIATKLKKKYNFEIIDSLADKLDVNDLVKLINDFDGEIVCFTAKTCQIDYILEVRKKVVGKLFILGGNHVSSLSNIEIENELSSIDYVIKGSNIEKIDEILTLINNGENNICKIHQTTKGEALNIIPEWSLLEVDKYNENIHYNYSDQDKSTKALPIMASYGCVYGCKFCSSKNIWGKSVKYRKVRDVVNEIISSIVETGGVKNFHFYDDNLMYDLNWVSDFCDEIIKNKLEINWIFLSRPEIILNGKHLIDKMKKAGCKGVELGYETGNNESLKIMGKNMEYETFLKLINLFIKKKLK